MIGLAEISAPSAIAGGEHSYQLARLVNDEGLCLVYLAVASTGTRLMRWRGGQSYGRRGKGSASSTAGAGLMAGNSDIRYQVSAYLHASRAIVPGLNPLVLFSISYNVPSGIPGEQLSPPTFLSTKRSKRWWLHHSTSLGAMQQVTSSLGGQSSEDVVAHYRAGLPMLPSQSTSEYVEEPQRARPALHSYHSASSYLGPKHDIHLRDASTYQDFSFGEDVGISIARHGERRAPLVESTGNCQPLWRMSSSSLDSQQNSHSGQSHHHYRHLAGGGSSSGIVSRPISTPPALSLVYGALDTSHYGATVRGLDYRGTGKRKRELENPLYSNKAFREYRERGREQRGRTNGRSGGDEEPKWPEELEDAFLDGNYPTPDPDPHGSDIG